MKRGLLHNLARIQIFISREKLGLLLQQVCCDIIYPSHALYKYQLRLGSKFELGYLYFPAAAGDIISTTGYSIWAAFVMVQFSLQIQLAPHRLISFSYRYSFRALLFQSIYHFEKRFKEHNSLCQSTTCVLLRYIFRIPYGNCIRQLQEPEFLMLNVRYSYH